MVLPDILKEGCKKFGTKTALVSKGKRWSFLELDQKVNQAAKSFLARGIKKGDRVVVLLRSSSEAVIAYYAIVKIGAIEVALNVTTESPDSIMYKINDCKPKALITTSLFAKIIPKNVYRESSLETFYCVGNPLFFEEQSLDYLDFGGLFATKVEMIDMSLEENDIASISYTSGTTGTSRGVMLSHANMLSASCAMQEYAQHLEEDKTLTLIPLYHAYGKSIVNSRFILGSEVFLMGNTSFPADIIHLIEKERITGLVGVPTMIKMVLDALKESDKYQGTSIKYISTGGSKMSEDLLKDILQVFRGSFVLSGYGLTEAGGKVLRKIFMQIPETKKKLNSCGTIIDNHELGLVDQEGRPVGPHEVGEILVKGPSVMQGYWNKMSETEEVLKDGWLYTGDLGILDEDGEIYIVDRKKDIIKSGGELISPQEIEEVINSHPEVQESAVIGMEDVKMGQLIKAFVVLKGESRLTEEDIIVYCSQKLPPIKIPKRIQFKEDLPKSVLKKIKKNVLREEERKNKIEA